MSSILRKIAQLQTLLTEMEEDIGISDNSTIEKRVLLAIADLSDDEEAEVARIFTSSSEGDHR